MRDLPIGKQEKYIAAGLLGFMVIALIAVAFVFFTQQRKLLNQGRLSQLVSAPTPTPLKVTEENIFINKYTLEPEGLRVKAGSQVDFFNFSNASVTVVGDAGSPELSQVGLLSNNGTVSILLKTAGTYHYFIKEHPEEKGTIVVLP